MKITAFTKISYRQITLISLSYLKERLKLSRCKHISRNRLQCALQTFRTTFQSEHATTPDIKWKIKRTLQKSWPNPGSHTRASSWYYDRYINVFTSFVTITKQQENMQFAFVGEGKRFLKNSNYKNYFNRVYCTRCLMNRKQSMLLYSLFSHIIFLQQRFFSIIHVIGSPTNLYLSQEKGYFTLNR